MPEFDAATRKKSKAIAMWTCVIFVIAVAALYPTTSGPSPRRTHPEGFDIGFADGKAFGQSEARLRHTQMGASTIESEATLRASRLSPEFQSGYFKGWSAGYSHGYDSFSK